MYGELQEWDSGISLNGLCRVLSTSSAGLVLYL
jgi:hypothetical protein